MGVEEIHRHPKFSTRLEASKDVGLVGFIIVNVEFADNIDLVRG